MHEITLIFDVIQRALYYLLLVLKLQLFELMQSLPAQTLRKTQLQLPPMTWKEYWGENCLWESD